MVLVGSNWHTDFDMSCSSANLGSYSG